MPVESYRVISDVPTATATEVIDAPKAVAPATTDGTMLDMRLPADAAMLIVELPAHGSIFVNGVKTSATGSVRRFVSRGLVEGKDYEFVVRMMVKRDGVISEETKVVSLSAGNRAAVSFNPTDATAELQIPGIDAVRKTILTLHVPADAKVWLAGNETASTGETRQFETMSLREGQAWKGYEIRVAAIVNGREETVSKVIDLMAGGVVELSLDPTQRTASADASVAVR